MLASLDEELSHWGFRHAFVINSVGIEWIFLACLTESEIEELSMKWLDEPSVPEINRGGVYEMDRQTKSQKMEMPHILVPV